jgi:glycerol-3-phosphate dehydrogenase subunit B
MRFGTVIIGGGLAGLTAGVSLVRKGETCAIVNAGQGSLHFSSGSFDFCNALPDGTPVRHPLGALPALAEHAPHHPYSLLGVEKVSALAREAEAFFHSLDAGLQGSLEQGNHLRMTPVGTLAPAWLSAGDACTVQPRPDGSPRWPWRKALLAGVKGYLDSQPEAVADRLLSAGLEVARTEISLPALEQRRKNSSEFRSITIARVLDREENTLQLAQALRSAAENADVVLFPACIGLREPAARKLASLAHAPVLLIPTMPPSLFGARINSALAAAFIRGGGVFMPGDRVVGYASDDGRISSVFTANLEDDPLRADNFLLASGSFFSKGMAADRNGIRESIFGLDLTEYPARRDLWSADDFFASQPFMRFGVKTDARMRAYRDGRPLANLYVAGLILGNIDAVAIGCGAGVCVVTALAAAGEISGTEERLC